MKSLIGGFLLGALFATLLLFDPKKHPATFHSLSGVLPVLQQVASPPQEDSTAAILNASNATQCNDSVSKSPVPPEIIAEIRAALVPPSRLPYNLTRPDRKDYSQFGEMAAFVRDHFHNKKGGTFIECGAYDGEDGSNTLAVERYFNWTGLLIEPIPKTFAKMVTKRRKVPMLNACVDYIHGKKMQEMDGGGQMATLLVEQVKNTVYDNTPAVEVPCYGFRSILAAAGIAHVDWLALDVEGNEERALLSWPWESVSLDVVQLECCLNLRLKGIHEMAREVYLTKFMRYLGYRKLLTTKVDIIYRYGLKEDKN